MDEYTLSLFLECLRAARVEEDNKDFVAGVLSAYQVSFFLSVIHGVNTNELLQKYLTEPLTGHPSDMFVKGFIAGVSDCVRFVGMFNP